jgi:hypothetical protein
MAAIPDPVTWGPLSQYNKLMDSEKEKTKDKKCLILNRARDNLEKIILWVFFLLPLIFSKSHNPFLSNNKQKNYFIFCIHVK